MCKRIFLWSLGFAVLGGSAMPAVPDQTPPSDKPPLSHASPMISDPTGTMIRGKAPAPSIDDPVIRGTRPVGTKPSDPTEDYLQAQVPDPSKPPLYRASPMINDPVTGTRIRGKAPVSTAPLIHATPQTDDGGN